MRCPSCGFVSFDHLTACKNCGKELPPAPGGRWVPAPPPARPSTGQPAKAPGASAETAGTLVTGGTGPAPPVASPPAGEDRPSFALPPAASAPPPPTAHYESAADTRLAVEFAPAGFWIRFVAAIVDDIILAILMLVAIVPIVLAAGIPAALSDPAAFARAVASLGTAIAAISFLVPMLYEVIFVGWRGQTPGKMALKLKIIRTDGAEADYVKAFIRWIGKMISGFILFTGYIMAAFTTNKRALHDYIAGTRVIRL